MDEKFDGQLKRVLAGSNLSWAAIPELVEYCTARIPSPSNDDLKYEWFAGHIRRVLKQNKTDDGLSEWESVVSTGPDGKDVRRYKQLTLFTVGDYQQVSQYHADRARYHGRKANTLVRRCMSLHKTTRMQLHFPEWGFLDDQDEAVA